MITSSNWQNLPEAFATFRRMKEGAFVKAIATGSVKHGTSYDS